MFKRLLVPLDGSPWAETALAPALALAQRFGAELLLVRTAWARTIPGTDPGPGQLKAIEEAQAYLEPIAALLRKAGVPVLTAVPYDFPTAGIVDQAAFRKVDLIVMAAAGRQGLAALLHRRIAWKVLIQSNAPLLVWKGSSAAGDVPRWLGGMGEASAQRVEAPDGSRLAESVLLVRSAEETSACSAESRLWTGPEAHLWGSVRCGGLDKSS